MRLRRAWLDELRRLGLVVLVLGVVGALIGRFWWLVAGAVPAYLGLHLWDLARCLRWIEGRAGARAPDPAGLCEDLVSAVIAERRTAERERREMGERIERLQTSIHALPDAIVVLDRDLRIVWSNEAASSLLGIRAGADQGYHVDNLVRHPDFIRLLRAGRYEAPVTIPSPVAPEQTVRIRVVPYGRAESVLLARDETEAVRLERMRQDFISNVSHELKTPLTVLAGYVETMSESAQDLPERWRRPTEAMSAQVGRMAQLVEDLLLLSRIESLGKAPKNEPVDVAAVIALVVEEARVMSGAKQHAIRVSLEPGLTLRGSESEIRTAFSNLVTNAVQYTPAGGEIDVRWYTDSEAAYFEVVDSGEGIDQVHLPRLTERFYRVDAGRSRERGGTGLGLAIVKHVLQHYDAKLLVESRLGEGSRFACRFPLGRVVIRGAPPLPEAESA